MQIILTAWRASLVLSLFSPALAADRTIAQFVHKAWTGKDGAPANIRAITQTTDDYLWLASSQGLYRFDGVEFERIESSGPTLTSVFSLLSCGNGDLWAGSAVSGISLLRNGTKRDFTAVDGFPGNAVLSIAQDRKGTIWAAAQGGLARFDGKKWRKVGAESGLEGPPLSLYADRKGALWASTIDSIYSLPEGAGKFQPVDLRLGLVMQILESPAGALWVTETTRGIFPMPPLHGPLIAVGSQRALFDRDGGLWITTKGLLHTSHPELLPERRIDDSSELLDSFTAKDGLTADPATSIYQDLEGNVWVGTSRGLDRFTKGAVVQSPAPGIFTNSAMAPGEGGDVWMGNLGSGSGRVHDNHWIPGTSFSVFSIVPDAARGTWWSIFDRHGFREIDGKLAEFDVPPAYANDNSPRLITSDRYGSPWLAGVPGICVRHDGKWESVALPNGFPGKYVKVAYTDHAGRLWFGYRENTILLIDGSVQRVLTGADGLRAGAVEAISSDGHATWITGSQGVQLFDGRRFRAIVPADGVVFGSVSGVTEASDGSLWLNTYRGVVRIAPAAVSKLKAGASKAEYSIYDTYDGLSGATQQSQPFQTLIEAKDGKIWFGTTAGPAWIDPNDIPRNKLAPPVRIHSVAAGGKRYASSGDLRLPALTRDLEVDYAALSFTVPERVHFRYKLDGSDGQWRDAGTRRQAFYTNLSPKHYRFHVMASNNDGIWNEAGASLDFSIAPAYYQTAWFHALAAIAVLALIWGAYRWRMHQLAHDYNVRFEERIAERTRIARELHDSLLQNFHGVLLRFQAAYNHLPSRPEEAQKALGAALNCGTEAITAARDTVQELRAQSAVGSELPAALATLAEELRASQIGGSSPAIAVEVEGRQNLQPLFHDEIYRIAAEALRNACRHADADRIDAAIEYGEREFRITVRDNGKGIDPAVLRQGKRNGHWGLPGMRERAEAIGAALDVWSCDGSGTEITLRVPAAIVYMGSVRAGMQRKKGNSRL